MYLYVHSKPYIFICILLVLSFKVTKTKDTMHQMTGVLCPLPLIPHHVTNASEYAIYGYSHALINGFSVASIH